MPINPSTKKIYESFEMLHPSGVFMSFVAEKRANWYVKKGLANWVGEKKFKLNFEPNGFGKNGIAFYEERLENRCVVCGVENDNLNKHHVVPYVFRSRFPNQYKESNHHDVLVTCVDCHENYESYAMQYKIQMVKEAGFKMHEKMTEEEQYNKKIIQSKDMLEKIKNGIIKKENIPKERMDFFEKFAKLDLLEIKKENSFWADDLMKKIISENKLDEFIINWRKHFIMYAKPKFLPKGWDVNHQFKTY